MKAILPMLLPIFLAGCAKSVDERADEYIDLSFALCGAKVKSYSQGEDGKIRVVCANESYFLVKDQQTLAYMNELNGAYCYGKGFSVFNERSNYYTFTCADDKSFNIPK